MSRTEMASDWVDLPLDARDAYTVYHVDSSARWVSLLDSASILGLEPSVRKRLLCLQSELGRGQIYPLDVYGDMTQGDPASGLAEPFTFATDNGHMVALQYHVWHALLPETRVRWLISYVCRERSVCQSSTFSEDVWHDIGAISGPMTRLLAGTFSPRSGPNCFSTTLAAAAFAVTLGERIADLWLHQGPFFRGLARLGYRPRGGISDMHDVPPRSVIVWRDGAGRAQHACFVPIEGWALNKDAQGWQAPRQLLPLSDVVDSWTEPTFTTQLYRANEGPRSTTS